MADENGLDDPSEPPEEGDQPEETRRVRPLVRFERKGKDEGEGETDPAVEAEEGEGEEDETKYPARVRPVRVVRFVPTSGDTPSGEMPEEAPFAETEEPQEEEETPFTAVEEVPEEVEGEEAPFAQADEIIPTFAEVVEEEAPFSEVMEVPEEGEEAPFTQVEEDAAAFTEAGEEGEEASFSETEDVPEIPFAAMEEAEREEIVSDTVSTEEEAEMSEDMQFRQEETPAVFERREPTPEPEEARPHYHKYLRPDEELLTPEQARGRPTGFDRDLETDAGEIDFGIELIDPSERRKKRTPPKASKEPASRKKEEVGGHDSDGEVGTRETGMDIGVDDAKRRRRRF